MFSRERDNKEDIFMKTYIIVLCALVTVFGGCVKAELDNAPQFEPKEKYAISVGDTIAFSISSNPTTGYSWGWLNQNSVSIVSSTGSQYTMDKTGEKGITGRGGKEIWKFIGVKNGSDTIKLGYRRPWESVQPIKTMNIFIRVH
jgi:inhibitor of cysteine peptidase